MADLLERDVIEVEQEGRRWRDDAARIFVNKVTQLIADCLGRGNMPEAAMSFVLDGVPMDIVLLAIDQLDVITMGGLWRLRRRA